MATYTGTPGNDTLIGSAAADVLDGGAGADSTPAAMSRAGQVWSRWARASRARAPTASMRW